MKLENQNSEDELDIFMNQKNTTMWDWIQAFRGWGVSKWWGVTEFNGIKEKQWLVKDNRGVRNSEDEW